MLVFASISLKMWLASGGPPHTLLMSLQHSPDPKISNWQECMGGGGKIRKKLKTPALVLFIFISYIVYLT